MEYDGAWKLELPADRVSDVDATWPPAFLANGKLVMLPTLAAPRVGLERSFLSVDTRSARTLFPPAYEHVWWWSRSGGIGSGSGGTDPQGARNVFGAAVQGFDFAGIRLFSLREGETAHALKGAKLHMDTGTYSASYDVSVRVPGDTALTHAAVLEYDAYPARQYPYCAVLGVRVRVREDALTALQAVAPDAASSACFFHQVACPSAFAHTARYDASVIYSEAAKSAAWRSAYVFAGSFHVPPSASASEAAFAARPSLGVHFASAYEWDDDAHYEHAGFNVARADPGTAFNRVNLFDGVRTADDPAFGGAPSRAFDFTVLTCTLTDVDAPLYDAREYARRVLLSAVLRGASDVRNGNRVTAHFRAGHVRRWTELWKANVVPVPKSGASAAEKDRVARVRRHVRYALYNVYASVRGGSDGIVDPYALGASGDGGGTTTGDAGVGVAGGGGSGGGGDLWLLPVLVKLKPAAAREFLEARLAALPRAQQLAASHGFAGGKFSLGDGGAEQLYGSTTYWDAVALTRVYDTAAVGVQAWDYYRVTRDKDWLKHAYPLLRAVADFVASAFRLEGGKYVLVRTLGLDDERQAEHNAFTANAGLLALKAAIEASYALGFGVQRRWTDVYFDARSIFFPTTAPSLKGVLRYDEAYEARDPVHLAEPLLVLTPTFSEVMYPEGKNLREGVKKNLEYYEAAVDDAGTRAVPFNALMLAFARGMRMQDDDAAAAAFADDVDAFIAAAAEPVWGNLAAYDGSTPPLRLNDITTSAAFVEMLLGAAAGTDVVGGVSETQFFYDELRLRIARYRRMPRTWMGLRVTGLGGTDENLFVTNELPYAPP